MSLINLLLIAFAMSTDAFAASLSKGKQIKSPRIINALKIGLIFGVVEGITPIIGWAIGSAGAAYVEAYDHWIAFTLLTLLGLHMIKESLSVDSPEDETNDALQQSDNKKSFLKVVLTAIGTSIDAMAVGVSFAFIQVNIWLAALMIGLATMTMVTFGALLGHHLGQIIGKRAETFGGILLILVGVGILYSHLNN